MARMTSPRIISLTESKPGLQYRCPGPKGTTITRSLATHEVLLDWLPTELEALVATADLQAREIGAPHRLLGEAVAQELLQQHSGERMGILIAGDFYATEKADKLGASGDVTDVWRAFHQNFRWLVGVLGNHDRLKEPPSGPPLDGHTVERDGLRIGGVSGIVGKAGRLLRRDLPSYLDTVQQVLSQQPHILILHESPQGGSPHQRGNPHLTELLEKTNPTLVVCGHCHWPNPLHQLTNGTQILNVDSRLCLMKSRQP